MQFPSLSALTSQTGLPQTGAAAEDTSSTSGSGSSSSSSSTSTATITSNDFLQLLVAEMQNQDPTDSTDPNEYIDQLVQVNSLQQLISINQDLTPSSSSSTSGSGTSSSVAGVAGASSVAGTAASTPSADAFGVSSGSSQTSSANGPGASFAAQHALPGTMPTTETEIAASASRVAEALAPPADASTNSSGSGKVNPSQLRKFSLAARGGLAVQP